MSESTVPVTRPWYRDGRYLHAADLEAEQAYHRDLRRRHNSAAHRWGIVAGLDLRVDPDGSVWAEPGLAVDGYGRELVLVTRLPVRAAAFADLRTDTLDVWLRWDRQGTAPPLAGTWDEVDRDVGRWTEKPRLELTVSDDTVDPRRPPGVPAEALDVPGALTPPDDPAVVWPVRLGTLRRDPAGTVTVDLARRPNAGLVAEVVGTPDDDVRIEVGSGGADPATRFAVVQGRAAPLLAVAEDGATTVRGTLTVEGGARIGLAGLEFEVGTASDSPPPWSVAVVTGTNGGEELRVTLPAVVPDATPPAFRVGAIVDGTFTPYLTVKAGGEVVIDGSLHVEKGMTEGAPDVPPRPLGGDVSSLLGGALFSGITGASGLLASLRASGPALSVDALARDITRVPGAELARRLRELSPERAEEMRTALAADEG